MAFSINAIQEREFEKKHILKQKEKYLQTDATEKYRTDRGYKAKIDLIESALTSNVGIDHWILDLGSNTSGESEVLASKGYSIVASDINEYALSISKERCEKYNRTSPTYIAGDSHSLPFANSTFDFIIAFEVLHHFEKIEVVLKELNRVLKPGGILFAYEPYAFNPYRRLAELRFLILGSIEKSFTVNGLHTLLGKAGFNIKNSFRNVLPPSEWKKKHATRLRAVLKDLYYAVSVRMLTIFGNIVVLAQKEGISSDQKTVSISNKNIYDRLICPKTGRELKKVENAFECVTGTPKFSYKIYNGIPVLIAEDASVV